MEVSLLERLAELFVKDAGSSYSKESTTDAGNVLHSKPSCRPLQRLFYYLSVKDLFVIASLSRKLNNDVEYYCKEICKRFSLEGVVQSLFHQQLKSEIYFQTKFKEANSKCKWLLMTWAKNMGVHRVSLAQYSFDNTPSIITKSYDKHLKRDIVKIENILWFHFEHTFSNTPPGKYRALLKINVDDVSSPILMDGLYRSREKQAITMKVSWKDLNGAHEGAMDVAMDNCHHVCKALDRSKNGASVKMKGGSLMKNSECNGWFNVCLDDIELDECSDVVFDFRDTATCWWTCGMKWDYIELIKIDWDTMPLQVPLAGTS